jgi:hypothetical protein
MPVGSLIVELSASIEKYTADLGKAAAIAEQNARRIDRAFSTVRNGLASLGVIVSAAGFVAFIKNTIDADEALLHLSQSTGIAVEQLGGISFAAKQAGTDTDGVAKAIGKFNVQIAKALDGNKTSAATFEALGISLKDLKNSSPDEILAKTADKFAQYEDGPNKAAIANAAFGKTYQSMIPLLDQGGQALADNIAYFQKYAGVTEQTAKESTDFNAELGKIKLISGAFAQTLAAELLPQMSVLAQELLGAKEKSGGFTEAAGETARVITNLAVGVAYLAHGFGSLGEAIGASAARLQLLGQGKFSAFLNFGDEEQKNVDKASADFDALIDKIRNAQKTTPQNTFEYYHVTTVRNKAPAPGLGLGKLGDDPTKALLDANIKAIEANIAEEKTLLATRNEILAKYYGEGYLSIKDYFAKREDAAATDLQVQLAGYDQEIALQREFIQKSTTTNVQRAKAEGDIVETIKKRTVAQQEAAKVGVASWFEEQRALEEYRHSLDDLTAQILTLQHNTAGAAAIRFDDQTEDLRKRLTAEGNVEALRQLDILRAQAVAQGIYNDALLKSGTIFEAIGTAQSRIDLAQQTGNDTELGALAKKSDLAQQYIAKLTATADAYEAVARASKDPAALAAVDALRLKIEQLAAQSDALAQKFRSIFEDAFAQGLTDIVTGTKSVKDAFNDMAKSITASIAKIAAQNVAESLFGKTGPLGGVSDFFASAFGGGIGSKPGEGGVSSLGAAAIAATPEITALAAAATSAAAALTSVSASSAAGGLGNLLGGSGGGFGTGSGFGNLDLGSFLADGGDARSNTVNIVGERGPELWIPKVAGTIVPSSALGKGRQQVTHNTSIVVNMPAGTSGASAEQVAREISRRQQIATRKNR